MRLDKYGDPINDITAIGSVRGATSLSEGDTFEVETRSDGD